MDWSSEPPPLLIMQMGTEAGSGLDEERLPACPLEYQLTGPRLKHQISIKWAKTWLERAAIKWLVAQ